MKSRNDKISLGEFGENLWLKREDLIDAEIPGNKYRKLKFNIEEAQRQGRKTLLTFGGAFSNHIAAVAHAGRRFSFDTIGVIRGEELADKPLNPTLSDAVACGMKLHFINREDYRNKTSEVILEALKQRFGDFYLIPEGGTNALAVKGCEQILTEEDFGFDYICCSVGTGGTIAGLANSADASQKVLGFSSLKGDFLEDEIRKWSDKKNFKVIGDYHFGGYAKADAVLFRFLSDFEQENKIALDPVYTGKMLFGIRDLYENGFFRKSDKILAIHTGGLQGWAGMNEKYGEKPYLNQ